MILDILIPTYNRQADLLRNLSLLKEQIIRAGLQSDVRIIISDNCSPDSTEVAVNHFIQENKDFVKIHYHRQSSNVGLEKNAVFVLSKSSSPHVMFLGDDDYLPEGYLEYCAGKIRNDFETGCIIPGLSSLLQDGTIVEGRKESFAEKKLTPGFESVWAYSHLGHQMSGVVLKTSALLSDYLNYPQYRNIYLFIYFVTNRLFRYSAFYAPAFKVIVSTFNAKDWGYNQIGLLDEVFKSYYPFVGAWGENRVGKLMIRFTVMHAYRLGLDTLTLNRAWDIYKSLSAKTEPLENFRSRLLLLLAKEYVKKKTKTITTWF